MSRTICCAAVVLQPVTPQQRASKRSYVEYTLRELHRNFAPGTLSINQQGGDNQTRCVLVWVGALRTSLHHLCARLVNDSDFQEGAATSLVTASSEGTWRSLLPNEQQQQLLQRALGIWCPPDSLCSSI